MDGLFVQTHCIGVAPFEAGDLGGDQCNLARPLKFSVHCSPPKLVQLFPVMRGQEHLRMTRTGPWRSRVLIVGRPRQCPIVIVFDLLEILFPAATARRSCFALSMLLQAASSLFARIESVLAVCGSSISIRGSTERALASSSCSNRLSSNCPSLNQAELLRSIPRSVRMKR